MKETKERREGRHSFVIYIDDIIMYYLVQNERRRS